MPTERSPDRDLLIELKTEFKGIASSVDKMASEVSKLEGKVDNKFDNFDQKLQDGMRSLTEQLKNEYVTKKDHDVLVSEIKEIKEKYVTKKDYEPVSEAYKEMTSTFRKMMIIAVISLTMAAATAMGGYLNIFSKSPAPVTQASGAK